MPKGTKKSENRKAPWLVAIKTNIIVVNIDGKRLTNCLIEKVWKKLKNKYIYELFPMQRHFKYNLTTNEKSFFIFFLCFSFNFDDGKVATDSRTHITIKYEWKFEMRVWCLPLFLDRVLKPLFRRKTFPVHTVLFESNASKRNALNSICSKGLCAHFVF